VNALATLSFLVCFAAWGLIGGLAQTFAPMYGLSGSQTAMLVAVPVLLGSLARLPMGILTDKFGGRWVFTVLMLASAMAAIFVSLTSSYASLLAAAFALGVAGSSFSVGAAFVSRWTPRERQGTALAFTVSARWDSLSRCLSGRSRRQRSAGRWYFAAWRFCSSLGRSFLWSSRETRRARLPRSCPPYSHCSSTSRSHGCLARFIS
jgi:MFS family permease